MEKLRCAPSAILLLAATSVCLGQARKTAVTPGPVAEVLEHTLAGVESEFISAAEAMPEDKYDFAPTGGEFKGVRTFAQQVKHVSAVNYLAAAAILGEKPPLETKGEKGPAAIKTKAEIVKFMKDSFAYAYKALATFTEKTLLQSVTSPFGEPTTRLDMAMVFSWHSMDHYGQMVEYLRMNRIIPPVSRQVR